MFEIPELDEMICQQLSRHDLAQCVRVDKKWHAIIAPYLWRDLTCLDHQAYPYSQQKRFRRLVLEDNLHQRLYRDLQRTGHVVDHPVQGRPHPSISTLMKYGPLIRYLPAPDHLLTYFHPPTNTSQPQSSATSQDKHEPTPLELLRHLYQHCPSFLIPKFRFALESQNPDGLIETIAEFVVPRACVLHAWSVNGIGSRRLMHLLGRPSDTLRMLSLDISIMYDDGEFGNEKQVQEDASKPWMNIKQLSLKGCEDKSKSKAFWPWLWRRCGALEEIELGRIGGIVEILAEGILLHMPNLSRIYFNESRLKDEEIADILSGSRNRWKEVGATPRVEFKDAAGRALLRHCSTLESLAIWSPDGLSEEHMVCLLTFSPNLHTIRHPYTNRQFSANAFVDQDAETGMLKPWACELSLREFNVKITGIPAFEMYHNPGWEVQSRVYDRVARFANLEILWLYNMGLSTECGLHKLAGLKSLKELGVSQMRRKIDVKDVQWMARHWPELRAIHGLRQEADNKREAVKWLEEHHPKIALT
ncbi:hypothetical protein B0O80DRAFT_435341 [Mortierella sp. GBAus27b]|nr:hypothetical protein B0O80DRAFT_435341 [Mortierella sp. GBAus27b]